MPCGDLTVDVKFKAFLPLKGQHVAGKWLAISFGTPLALVIVQ